MEPVKLGVIGCGVIGSSHLRTAVNSSLIDLVAVADLIEDKRLNSSNRKGSTTAVVTCWMMKKLRRWF